MIKYLVVPYLNEGVLENEFYTSLTNVLYVESAGDNPQSNTLNVYYNVYSETSGAVSVVEIDFNENQIDNEGLIWFQNLVETALREDYTKVIYEVENLPPNLTINQMYIS